jgi:hypothetical protein
MSNELTRISRFIETEITQAPARTTLTVHRTGALGDEIVTTIDLTKNAKKAVAAVKEAIVRDLTGQSGLLKYTVRVMGSTSDPLGNIIVSARGTAEGENGIGATGLNAAMGVLVKQAFEQTLEHHRTVVDEYKDLSADRRGDLAVANATIDELRAEIRELQSVQTGLVIAHEKMKESTATPIETAQAHLIGEAAALIKDVPKMIGMFTQKRDVKALPVSADAVRAFREAASKLSDASITAAIKAVVCDHASAGMAITMLFTEEERNRLKPTVAAIIGQGSTEPTPDESAAK